MENSPLHSAFDRILHKLAEVRRQGLKCFGSDSHHFRLNRHLSESAISIFEDQHGIRLPEDYRQFLLAVGNGGAGPSYGVLPLEHWSDAVLEDHPNYLARPSPLRPDMPPDTPWEETLHCAWEDLFQGTLALAHQGCAYYALLVVTGPYRGKVVYVNLDRCGAPYFVLNDDFVSWYERWLDELLWGYDMSWFGFGLPGREEDMVAMLRRGPVKMRLHVEAMSTLMRLPKLLPDTMLLVRELLAHADPKVQCRAIQLLQKHLIAEGQDQVRNLRDDPDAEVRQAALVYLAKIPVVDWEQIARGALLDEAEPVVFRAMCLLKDAKLLRRSDIETMLRSKNTIVRSRALWAADTVVEGPGQVRISDDHLFDPSKEVRRYAILAATRDNIPSLLRLIREERDPAIISCVLGALAKFGDVSAVPAIIDFTLNSDGFVRQDAARALGKMKDLRGVEALRRLLADHSIPTRTDENGITQMTSGESVSTTAREALIAIEHPSASWLWRWFSKNHFQL